MKYYVNKETGQLLDELQMKKQFKDQYDGFDSTNIVTIQDVYEEVKEVKWQDNH